MPFRCPKALRTSAVSANVNYNRMGTAIEAVKRRKSGVLLGSHDSRGAWFSYMRYRILSFKYHDPRCSHLPKCLSVAQKHSAPAPFPPMLTTIGWEQRLKQLSEENLECFWAVMIREARGSKDLMQMHRKPELANNHVNNKLLCCHETLRN